MNPNWYRLHEIHKIEKELQEERLKHSVMIKKIPLFAELLHWLPFDFSVLYVSFERLVFIKFRRNHRNDFWEGFTWIERVFWKCFIFSESNGKIPLQQNPETWEAKNLIEMQVNNIINMVSKTLLDDRISEVEFENILSRTRKRNVSYKKFDEVHLELDKLMPKMLLGRKSESFV